MKGARVVVPIAGALTVAAMFGGREVYTAIHAQGHAPAAALPKPLAALAITALGRIEPKNGVFHVSGPSHPAVVIDKLFVDDGDRVKAGQTIAVLDNSATQQARVMQIEAELNNAEVEQRRNEKLFKDGFVSVSELDAWATKATALRAQLASARAELNRTVVRAPVDGQVLEVHTREGERVGPDGIAEIGQTQAMYVVAEVYETDIGKVSVGQRATISDPALSRSVQGTVERIGLKVGKKDLLSVDPAAKADARVVEVEIRLDDADDVRGLTNLEVDVAIAP